MPVALLSACVALTMVVAATRPPQTTASVIAVTIDAVVVDAAGRPVTRLGADSFRVELDGQRRPIVTITYIPGGAPMAGAIGPLFDAVTAATPVYRLVVQPPDGTAAGREFTVAVTVDSPGVKVQVPQRVAAAPVTVTGTLSASVSGTTKSTEERLRDLLATGRAEHSVPIRVARAMTMRGVDSSKVTLHLGMYIDGKAVKPPLTPLIGSVDERGRVQTGLVPLEREHDTYIVNVALSLEPGDYKVRFAVVDAAGALGAIELTGRAQLHAMGPLLASDLIRWTWDSGDRPMPALDDIPAGGTLTMSLELYPAPGAAAPPDVLVKMELAGIERIVTPDARDGKLVADAEFPVDRLAAGTYSIRATVSSAANTLGTVSRTVVKR